MTNQTQSSVEYEDFEEYEIQTLSPRLNVAFRLATVTLLVGLVAIFRPVLRFLRRRRKRRKESAWIIRETTLKESNTSPLTEPCTMFLSMADDDEMIEDANTRRKVDPRGKKRNRHRKESEDASMDMNDTETCIDQSGCYSCHLYDFDVVLNELDEFEYRESFGMIPHITEDGTLEDLVPLYHTSCLQVHPHTRRENIFQRNDVDDTDTASDRSGDTCSDIDDNENDEKFDLKYCLGYSWEDLTTEVIDYNSMDWEDLPTPVVKAAKILGFNQMLWDSDQVPSELVNKAWNELSPEEKAACTVLGVDETKWDGECDSCESQSVELPYRSWDELPKKARSAAVLLGYNQVIWDTDEIPDIGGKQWNELSEGQRNACRVLGFNQRTWDDASSQKQQVDPITCNMTTTHDSDLLCTDQEEWRKVASKVLVISNVLSCDHETRRLLQLSFPATIASSIFPILKGATTAAIVIFMGPATYLSWIMSNFFLDWSDSVSAGFAEAEKILCVQAIGMQKYFLAGQYVQLTVILHALLSITFYGIFVFLIGRILSGLDFGEHISQLATEYIPLAALSRLVHGCCVKGIERLMWSEERGKAMLVIETSMRVLQLVGIILALAVFHSESLLTIGVVELAFAMIHAFFMYTFCNQQGWIAKYERGLFGNWAMSNASLTTGLLKMSFPLAIGQVMAHGEWQLLTLFATYMGPAETTVWTIAAIPWNILKEIPTGMINAAEIRIGRSLGLGRPHVAKLIAYKSFMFTFLIAIFADIIFFLIRKPLVEVFTDDDTLQKMAYDLIFIICIGNVVLAVGSNAHTILETQRRAKTAVLIYFFSMFGITVPLAAWLVFERHYGLESMMMSCVFGYSIMTFCMLVVVFTTNWPKTSQKVILKSTRDHTGTTTPSEETLCENTAGSVDLKVLTNKPLVQKIWSFQRPRRKKKSNQ